MEDLIKSIKLKDLALDFYSQNYVIATVKEDVIFDQDHVKEILDRCIEVFDNESYVYISHRKEKYNVNPTVYLNLHKVAPLAGIALVAKGLPGIQTANFERKFSPVPLNVFENLEDARSWAVKILKNKKAGL